MEHKVMIEQRATCACGWRSKNVYTGVGNQPLLEFAAHVRSCSSAPTTEIKLRGE